MSDKEIFETLELLKQTLEEKDWICKWSGGTEGFYAERGTLTLHISADEVE